MRLDKEVKNMADKAFVYDAFKVFKENNIVSFRGEYNFLSNFHPVKFLHDGILMYSVEHAYIYEKFKNNAEVKRWVKNITNAGALKRKTKGITPIEGWNRKKLNVMYRLCFIKFGTNSTYKHRLISTGDKEIIEGNTWGDKFWGVVEENGEFVGDNYLGRILMSIRNMISYDSELISKVFIES